MVSDKPLAHCPECQLSTIRRIPQLPAVIFIGPGWYSIDRRSPSGQKIGVRIKKNDKAGNIFNDESEN